ncbi:hypothetical protein [Parafilimonas sp.]|uniref:hypothetical protein n=1 Tax=Parafilimonas sp. TaxID=1969739 RepID=UPI0039E33659
MFKISPVLTARLGGGLGYKTPTVFTEEAERIQFQHILPINAATAVNERSVGGNIDLNYKTHIGRLGFSGNILFFYTKLNKPLILTDTSDGNKAFVNANGHIDTRSLETILRFSYKGFKLFIGYTYGDVNSQ